MSQCGRKRPHVRTPLPQLILGRVKDARCGALTAQILGHACAAHNAVSQFFASCGVMVSISATTNSFGSDARNQPEGQQQSAAFLEAVYCHDRRPRQGKGSYQHEKRLDARFCGFCHCLLTGLMQPVCGVFS